MIDLHTHSTASDGTLSPRALMREAKAAGLSALALCDHDTVDGLAEAEAESALLGIELVPAVELSLTYRAGSLHMLGYFIDFLDPAFLADLAELGRRREARNDRMREALAQLGIVVTEKDLMDAAGGEEQAGAIGRPHFAKVLIAKGVVASFEEAFDRYLGKGKPAYVPKARLLPEEGIELIHRGKGLAVLAHPKYCGAETPEDLETLVSDLRRAGLDGIECFYTDHSPDETQRFLSLAARHALAVTGGTDFHGDPKPGVSLGRLPGGRRIHDSFLEDLKRRRASR